MSKAICHIDDIKDQSAREFTSDGLVMVLYRDGNQVFAYKNACPHLTVPLNWMPEQFMDPSKQHLQCSTHGALFRPKTGLCIAGPCAGESLTAIAIQVDNRQVFLA